MDDYSTQTLGVMIKDLKERSEEQYQHLARVVNDGNSGICRRLDTLNGNVARHQDYIVQHKEEYKDKCNKIELLMKDREDKFKKYSDLFWRALLIIVLGGLGISQIADKLL